MKLVFVGESWGEHEAKFKHPLVWYTGRELAKMMAHIGLSPPLSVKYPKETDMITHWQTLQNTHSIFVTNVFNEHPPYDKTETFFASVSSGQELEVDLPSLRIGSKVLKLKSPYRHHIERLWQELEEHKPNLVVSLGNYACWALLGYSGIRAIRGSLKRTLRLNLKCIPTYHPAALRDWSLRSDIIADLTKIKEESEFADTRRIKRYITCEDTKTNTKITLKEIEDWFNRKSEEYSIDIETAYALYTRAELKNMTHEMKRIVSELISMISFARSPYESIVIPFMTRNNENLNYWSSVKEEAQVLRIVIRELASPVPKLFQNGIFDISHLLRNRIRVLNATDDSMILSHALFPKREKSLGYLRSVWGPSEIAWKKMRTGGESLKREE